MSISQINASNYAAILSLPNSSNYAVERSDYANELSDEYSESDETSKFKEIVGKYDITNMSRNEANTMYKELYDNKLISLKDLGFATLDLTKVPWWKDGVSSVDGAKLSSDPNKKVDFLEIFETQANWVKQYGNSLSQKNRQNMLELAEKIHCFQS